MHASIRPTEHRDSLPRKKASSIPPQKHHNKNNHHRLPVSSSPVEKGENALVLPRRSPPTRLQMNLQPAEATRQVQTRSLPPWRAKEQGSKGEVSGRVWGGKVCAVLAAQGAQAEEAPATAARWDSAPPPRCPRRGAQRPSAPQLTDSPTALPRAHSLSALSAFSVSRPISILTLDPQPTPNTVTPA